MLIIIILIAIASIIIIASSLSTKQSYAVTPINHDQTKRMVIEFEDSTKQIGKYIVVDTETTGLQPRKDVQIENSIAWPYILQIAWVILDKEFKSITEESYYLDYKGVIPFDSTRVHHIDSKVIKEKGVHTIEVLNKFLEASKDIEYIVGHNVMFDYSIIEAELFRNGFGRPIQGMKTICTMKLSKEFVSAYNINGNVKNPKLEELYLKCFLPEEYGAYINNNHDAFNDAMMTAKCLQYLVENNILTEDGKLVQSIMYTKTKVQKQKLTGELLKPNLDVKCIDNPFYGKKVVISGTYNKWPDRHDLANIIKDCGADIDSTVSVKTDYLIAGYGVGPVKLRNMYTVIEKNPNAKILYEKEVIEIIKEIDIKI